MNDLLAEKQQPSYSVSERSPARDDVSGHQRYDETQAGSSNVSSRKETCVGDDKVKKTDNHAESNDMQDVTQSAQNNDEYEQATSVEGKEERIDTDKDATDADTEQEEVVGKEEGEDTVDNSANAEQPIVKVEVNQVDISVVVEHENSVNADAVSLKEAAIVEQQATQISVDAVVTKNEQGGVDVSDNQDTVNNTEKTGEPSQPIDVSLSEKAVSVEQPVIKQEQASTGSEKADISKGDQREVSAREDAVILSDAAKQEVVATKTQSHMQSGKAQANNEAEPVDASALNDNQAQRALESNKSADHEVQSSFNKVGEAVPQEKGSQLEALAEENTAVKQPVETKEQVDQSGMETKKAVVTGENNQEQEASLSDQNASSQQERHDMAAMTSRYADRFSKDDVVVDAVETSFNAEQAAAQKADAVMHADSLQSPSATRVERIQDLMGRLDEHVLDLVVGKDKQMTISLIPETMGKIVMTCREDAGQLNVQLVAENATVRNLLQQQEQTVKQLLEQNGYRMTGFDVQTQADLNKHHQFGQRQDENEEQMLSSTSRKRTAGVSGGADQSEPIAGVRADKSVWYVA